MKVCYPGTFDPITNGHLDIIVRASKMFEEVHVLIMRNILKTYLFSEEERKQMIEDSINAYGGLDNVYVHIGEGLTVDYVHSLDAKAIIRGIRAISDYEYELMQATTNQKLAEDIETVFLIAKPEYSFISSSAVKEVARNKGDISPFVPSVIIDKINNKVQGK